MKISHLQKNTETPWHQRAFPSEGRMLMRMPVSLLLRPPVSQDRPEIILVI